MTGTLRFQIGTHHAGTRLNVTPRNAKTVTAVSPKTGEEFILPNWFVDIDTDDYCLVASCGFCGTYDEHTTECRATR